MFDLPNTPIPDALAYWLNTREGELVERWSVLLQETQPNLFRCQSAAAWAERAHDVLGALQQTLEHPERLCRPVFCGRSGSGAIYELAERAVKLGCEADLEVYELQGAYFLLEEALTDALHVEAPQAPRLEALVLADRFFKQLTVAMSMAITAERTQALERAVETRTFHLNETLRKQDDFVSFVSHEVRTGLTAILGACDFLTDISEDALSAEQARFVRIIERSGQLINVLVNDILDYAKLEAGRVSLRMESVHLREIATDAVALLEAKWGPKGITMDLEVSPELPEVAGDRIRLQQVYLNLLANAIRFTPDYGEIRLVGGANNGCVWVVSRERLFGQAL